MKSVLITFLLFGAVLLLIRFKVFDILSSTAFIWTSFIFLCIAIAAAVKVLGIPFLRADQNKDKEHEK